MDTSTLALGFVIGGAVGFAGFKSNFCVLGAATDIVLAGDWRRARTWMVALAVALIGTQTLVAAGMLKLDATPYLAAEIAWLPLITGGWLFGIGMTLTGGCPNRALVRLGSGSLKSLLTLVLIGLSAAVTLAFVPADLGGTIPLPAIGLTAGMGFVVAAVLAAGLLVFSFKDAWFRASPDQWLGALVIGAMIPAAWAVTARSGAAIPQAITFIVPLADAVRHAVASAAITFGEALTVGVVAGAFAAAAATRDIALEMFVDRADLLRHVAGGVLMGGGGTLALGCTFGQGLSGLSTLSPGSLLAVAAMFLGTLCGLRYLEAGSIAAAIRLMTARSPAQTP